MSVIHHGNFRYSRDYGGKKVNNTDKHKVFSVIEIVVFLCFPAIIITS